VDYGFGFPYMKPSLAVLVIKRLVDLLVGWIGTLFFVLLFPFIALLIRLESKGPVIYSQIRVGINRRMRPYQIFPGKESPESEKPGYILSHRQADYGGEPFTILKFRTMRIDAESLGPQLAKKGLDPRVTYVGKWLRALHLDELPQFVNILRGDMSLIGPRPERPHYTEKYAQVIPHFHDRTLWIQPGLTGLAQVLVGYDDGLSSVVRKVHYDFAYRSSICNFGSWVKMELHICWKTLGYLFVKPSFEEGETRDLASLRRAKLLEFRSQSESKADLSKVQEAVVHTHRTRKSLLLMSDSPEALCKRLHEIHPETGERLEVQLRPSAEFDLEDLGYLITLIQRVDQNGGRFAIKNSSPRVMRMLKEIKLDHVVDLHRPQDTVRNFMTVDVECWFHAYNLREQVPPATWHLQETRIIDDIRKILNLFKAHDSKATFFVLGWVADHYPDVVRMIEDEGHEIGTHGYYHNLITEMTPSLFEEDLEKSLESLARCSKSKVIGHRASNFTIVESTLWALEILRKFGMEYDSSIFPFKRERYGIARYPNRQPHRLLFGDGGSLIDIPMGTMGTSTCCVVTSGFAPPPCPTPF
jgi:polysaccharide deacetylase family protein (PEP-CTERM system associated)